MTRPVTILFYNEFWASIPESLPDSPWPYRLLFDSNKLPEADVVVFHIPTLKEAVDVEERPGAVVGRLVRWRAMPITHVWLTRLLWRNST